ncbi:MAG: hypothetical protein DI626_11505 [Micavibrio aeruginosavorus]|uniref:DUF748 domain-containing protein n=1 Tax=Micavibrio aeruginosavorus TaxID=349221 RepID=A0A2W4ZI96_9BACT|nr:MAG: hypothetical protein DI626_11505 [Micavibrio aeruginosavorus]
MVMGFFKNKDNAINDETAPHKRHRVRKTMIWTVVILIALLIAGRAYLPIWLKDHVNETLNNIDGYRGSVEDIDVALYRGAYTIHGLELFKIDKNIPVPFLDIRTIDLSLQWGALFHGEIVGDVTLDRPIINFARSSTGQTAQTGVETDWTKPIKELMPLDINFVEINDGRIAYQDFSTTPKVDIFIEDMYAKVTNLRNVEDKNAALPSVLQISGKSIGGGDMRIDGKLNILKKVPDAEIKAKLEKVNLPALNDYARAFAGIDFEQGNFNLYSDLNLKNGNVTGYIKPLATDIHLIDLSEDPFTVLWESFVAAVVDIFSNQRKDQFATQIELQGTIDSPETNFWSTLRGIFRNAFVQAYTNTIKPE